MKILFFLLLAFAPTRTSGFQVVSPSSTTQRPQTLLGYEPKWKKKETLGGAGVPKDFKDIGIKGTISVEFKQGNETKTTMAFAGQPLRDVATQAGQFIKYGCGKGEWYVVFLSMFDYPFNLIVLGKTNKQVFLVALAKLWSMDSGFVPVVPLSPSM